MKLGLEKVPVHVAVGPDAAQIKAYRIADNQTATLAELGLRPAAARTGRLQGAGLRPGPARLRRRRPGRAAEPGDVQDGLTDPDDVPEPPDEAITQPGDLWILGDHRLLCGDSSKPEDVDRLLDGAADPPREHRPAVQRQSRAAVATTPSPPASARSPAPRTTRGWTSLGIPRSPSRRARSCGPRTGRWPTTSCPTRSSTACSTPGSATSPACSRPGRGFYIWGGYANCGNYPPVLKAHGLYFSPGDHLGQAASGADAQGLHGRRTSGASTAGRKAPRTSLLGPNNATDLWHVKKVNPQSHGPFDREAGRAGRAGDAVLVPHRRERAGPVRRQRLDADRRRADGPQGVPDGTRPAVLRRDRRSGSSSSPGPRPSGSRRGWRA